jgi:hypothetical protein
MASKTSAASERMNMGHRKDKEVYSLLPAEAGRNGEKPLTGEAPRE